MTLVQVLAALLTPLIAVITTYIAIQQYRTQKLKLRHELYDRRFQVYKQTLEFIQYSVSCKTNSFSKERLDQFGAVKEASFFLFDNDVAVVLNELYDYGF